MKELFEIFIEFLFLLIPSLLMIGLVSYLFGPTHAATFGPEGGIEHHTKAVSPPGVAIDDRGRIYLSWIEEEGDVNSLYLALSDDRGRNFKERVKINSPDDAPASIHHSPSIAVGPEGEVYVAWISRGNGDDSSGDLRLSRSLDRGRTFGPSVKVNDNRRPASIGFESMGVGPDGMVYVAWLDGRNRVVDGKTSTYMAGSADRGRTFGKNILIDRGSCPCCRTALVAGEDGTVYVAWRKVFAGNVREIVVAASAPGGRGFSAPVIVGNDRWEIAGCPHRGPSMGIDQTGDLLITWYTEGEGEPRIYIARASTHSMVFEKKSVDHSSRIFPDHPVMGVQGDRIFLAYEETTPVVSNIIFESRRAGRVDRERLNSGTRRASYPAIATNRGGQVVVAWHKDGIRSSMTVVRAGSFQGKKRR